MKYAILDFDGTIVDSMKYWRHFAKAYLIENGYEVKGELPTVNKTDWLRAVCDYYYQNYGIEITPSEFHRWGLGYMRRMYAEEIDFKPGAGEALVKMKTRGIKMCICSSTDYSYMEKCLERLGIMDYFDFTVHCRRYGKEKDDPDIFLECMRRFGGGKPSEAVVFEDSSYALSTAKSRGFYTVGIYDPEEKNPDLMKRVSDQYLYFWTELDYSDII